MILLNQKQVHKILTEEYGLLYKKTEYSEQHLYFINSKIFAESVKEQLETERGNFLIYQEFKSKLKENFILIFNQIEKEIGKYYLDCWGSSFDNCETNSDGENWIDILTENELRKMVSETLHKVKIVENQIELGKIQNDFI